MLPVPQEVEPDVGVWLLRGVVEDREHPDDIDLELDAEERIRRNLCFGIINTSCVHGKSPKNLPKDMKEDFSSGVIMVLPVLEPFFPNCPALHGVEVDNSLSEEKSEEEIQ